MANTKKVVENEALESEVSFEYDGVQYTVPPAKKWPLDAVEAQEDGKMLGFLKALLGADQYSTLRKTTTTLADLDTFITALFEALDVDAGK